MIKPLKSPRTFFAMVVALLMTLMLQACTSGVDAKQKDEATTQYAVSKKMADGFRQINVSWSSEPTAEHMQQFLDQNTVAWRAIAGADSRPVR